MFSQEKNKVKRKPPNKKYIPIVHKIRDTPIDVYKGAGRCYDGKRRYHRDSKSGVDKESGKKFV